jgi:hypothetical protein
MMLFSRIVVLRYFLPNVIAITAIGIDAVTVSPAFSARYTVEHPNRIPASDPRKIDLKVNSAMFITSGDTYGLKDLFCSMN